MKKKSGLTNRFWRSRKAK